MKAKLFMVIMSALFEISLAITAYCIGKSKGYLEGYGRGYDLGYEYGYWRRGKLKDGDGA